jgi:drug/metabolite transporter (DMT)-like permease
MMELVMPVVTAAATAAVYGGYAYMTKRIGDGSTEFDTEKLIGTILVGAGVGAVSSLMGLPTTESAIIGVMGTIGAVEVGQKILKPIFNYFRNFPKASEVAAK